MSKKGAQVLEEALSLPASERAEMVDHLLQSLDTSRDPSMDELWAQESEDRLDAFERGEVTTVSASEAFRDTKNAKP